MTITLVSAVSLALELEMGGTVAGAPITVSAINLMPDSEWTLTMRSSPVIVSTGRTDSNGKITNSANLPNQVEPGAHRLILDAWDINGNAIQLIKYLNIGPRGNLSYEGDVANPENVPTPDPTQPPVDETSPSVDPLPVLASVAANAHARASDASTIPNPTANIAPTAPGASLSSAEMARLCTVVTNSQGSNLPAASAENEAVAGHRGTTRVDGTPLPSLSDCAASALSAADSDAQPITPTLLDVGGVASVLSAMAFFGFLVRRRKRQRDEEENLADFLA